MRRLSSRPPRLLLSHPLYAQEMKRKMKRKSVSPAQFFFHPKFARG
jgi:hypothetical protein